MLQIGGFAPEVTVPDDEEENAKAEPLWVSVRAGEIVGHGSAALGDGRQWTAVR
jgi:hypothetical protein